METPLTSTTRNKHCVGIKKERQVETKKELIRKLFELHTKEIAVVFLNVKLLSETIGTNCLVSLHDQPSQRKHNCLMMDKEESVNMYFEEIVKKKKKDFSLIN